MDVQREDALEINGGGGVMGQARGGLFGRPSREVATARGRAAADLHLMWKAQEP